MIYAKLYVIKTKSMNPQKKPAKTLGEMCLKYQLNPTPSILISKIPAMVPVESKEPPHAVA